jgi:crotonobetainyl-CoA:carnitine CoA-transferase CaiB-like acyl-CoA transferase
MLAFAAWPAAQPQPAPDILIENFKVGGLAKYGLDYGALAPINPRLVYCSITGFGQTGPYRDRAGYDFMVQGIGGLMSITGAPDNTPGTGPIKVGVAVADIFTGLYAAIGILAALRHREQTGRGDHIDMALLDVQVAVLANQALNYLMTGVSPARLGNAHPNIVPYQTFATSDGHFILAVGNDSQFRRFCETAGCPELADDALFASNPALLLRVNSRAPLWSSYVGIHRRVKGEGRRRRVSCQSEVVLGGDSDASHPT